MRYALLAYQEPGAFDALTPEERAAWVADDVVVNAEMADRGCVVGGEGLADVDTATTVRVRGGEAVVTDGPFAETTEHLVGVLLIDVDDLDEALSIARRLPAARTGTLEVRPVRAR